MGNLVDFRGLQRLCQGERCLREEVSEGGGEQRTEGRVGPPTVLSVLKKLPLVKLASWHSGGTGRQTSVSLRIASST